MTASSSIIKLFLGLLLFASISQAQAKDLITWHHPDFAPSYILQGPDKGNGIIEPIERFILSKLPEYDHKIEVSNFKRIIRTLESGQNACAVAILKTPERAKMTEYSIPHFLVHPVRIIIRKSDLAHYTPYKKQDGTYSLETILKDNKVTLGYSHGRSYSKTLDNLISLHATKLNSVMTARRTILEGLLRMLDRKRFDFTLGYAHEALYFMRKSEKSYDFITLPISEQNTFNEVFVGCSKTDWGHKVIQQVNKILIKHRSKKSYYGSYLNWLDPIAAGEYPRIVAKAFKE
ncbi:MAG: TIGR02285 family protein [Alphaproteobacteria bacterium]|nr:TIGR02285 family protein [Alphaproteobacteria bacterium]